MRWSCSNIHNICEFSETEITLTGKRNRLLSVSLETDGNDCLLLRIVRCKMSNALNLVCFFLFFVFFYSNDENFELDLLKCGKNSHSFC